METGPALHLLWLLHSSFYGPTRQVDCRTTPGIQMALFTCALPYFFCHDTQWDQYEPILARATRSFKCMAILPLQAIEATELQYASTHWEGEHLLFDGSAACAIQSLPVPHDMAEYISRDPTNWPLFNSYFPLDPSLITLAFSMTYWLHHWGLSVTKVRFWT